MDWGHSFARKGLTREMIAWNCLNDGAQAGLDPQVWKEVWANLVGYQEELEALLSSVTPLARATVKYLLEGKKRNYVWVSDGLKQLRENFPPQPPPPTLPLF